MTRCFSIYSLLWEMLGLHTFTNGMGMGNTNGNFRVVDIRVIQMEKVQSKNMKTTIDLYESLKFYSMEGREVISRVLDFTWEPKV